MASSKLGFENPIVFASNLPYDTTGDELYVLFGKFGAIRQIRLGNENTTKGSAYIVFEEAADARVAVSRLSGFNFKNRYLVVVPHNLDKMKSSFEDLETRKRNLEMLKKAHDID